MTEAAGLPAALGALLAGASLSQTRYRYQVEADVAPFRGVARRHAATVGFSVDFGVVAARPRAALAATLGLVAAKAAALVPLGLFFRLPAAAAARTGLLLAPAGVVLSRWGSPRPGARCLDGTTIDDGRRARYVPHARLSSLGDRLAEPLDRLGRVAETVRRARDDAAVGRAVKNAGRVGGGGRIGRGACRVRVAGRSSRMGSSI